MIFAHTIDKVLSGEKTQTRRLIKPRTIPPPKDAHPEANTDGEWLYDAWGTQPLTVYSARPCAPGTGFYGLGYTKVRPKYRVGSQHSVQPGRGQKAVGRIEITRIRREDVRCISHEDAIAEGFESESEFLEAWTRMHDPSKQFYFKDDMYHYYANAREKWVKVNDLQLMNMLLDRPAERYQAWVLEFKLVETS